MKNLEDIPKNHPFKVPEDYFDQLPGRIQSRIGGGSEIKEHSPYFRFRYVLQYAVPVIVLAVVAVFYFKPEQKQDANSLLASVSTEELMTYLDESEMTTDELIETLELDDESIEAIEAESYFNFELDENNLEDLNIDLENF